MGELQVYSAMQTDVPKKSYIKTQLGKVVVKVLNPFDDTPMEVILEGNPRKYEEGCIVDLWNDKQIVYFERMNKGLIHSGYLQEISREQIMEVSDSETLSHYSKKDKIDLFSRSYMSFRHLINSIYSIDFLADLVEVGKEIDAPTSYINVIEARIDTLAVARSTEFESDEEYTKPKEKTQKKRGRPKKEEK